MPPKNKTNPQAASKRLDDLCRRMGQTMKSVLKATRELRQKRYDGVLGTLPAWVPGNFHAEFERARNRVLDDGYEPQVVRTFIAELIRTYRVALANPKKPYVPAIIIPHGIRREVSVLAHLWSAVRLREVKGLAFLTDPTHAGQAVKGGQFSTGGASKRGKEYEPKASIRKICTRIKSTQFDDVLNALRDADKCKDWYESTSNPIGVNILGVDNDREQISYSKRGESPDNPRQISFGRLRSILTEIKK